MTQRHTPGTLDRLRAWIVAMALVLGLVACAKTLGVAALKSEVAAGVESQLALEVSTVECPEGRTIQAGDSFECWVTPAIGGRLIVRVTQKDDRGSLAWEVARTEGLLDLEALESRIQDSLREQASVEAAVDCGGTLKAAASGQTFTCTATPAGGDPAEVTVTMQDTEGNVSWVVDAS